MKSVKYTHMYSTVNIYDSDLQSARCTYITCTVYSCNCRHDGNCMLIPSSGSTQGDCNRHPRGLSSHALYTDCTHCCCQTDRHYDNDAQGQHPTNGHSDDVGPNSPRHSHSRVLRAIRVRPSTRYLVWTTDQSD